MLKLTKIVLAVAALAVCASLCGCKIDRANGVRIGQTLSTTETMAS